MGLFDILFGASRPKKCPDFDTFEYIKRSDNSKGDRMIR